MKLRPCIDLHGGMVKQIVGGSLKDGEGATENFVSDKDSRYFAELFKSLQLTGGHVIMLGKGNEAAAKQALEAYPRGLQVGGGINEENALAYINYGASHVIVTSYVFNNGKFDFEALKRLSDLVGKDKLVIDLSCKKIDDKYFVATNRWQYVTNFEVNTENLKQLSKYCDEFLIHGVDVEGKKNGFDRELFTLLADNLFIPITYAGGFNSMKDILDAIDISKNIDITIGSALDIYGGDLSMLEVVNLLDNI